MVPIKPHRGVSLTLVNALGTKSKSCFPRAKTLNTQTTFAKSLAPGQGTCENKNSISGRIMRGFRSVDGWWTD